MDKASPDIDKPEPCMTERDVPIAAVPTDNRWLDDFATCQECGFVVPVRRGSLRAPWRYSPHVALTTRSNRA